MSFFDDMARMFQTFYMRQASSLGDNAKAAFFAGQYMAAKGMGDPIGGSINQAANAYAAKYTQLLQDEGVTIINGKANSWYRDSSEQQRNEVAEIIRKGVAEGRPTGVREKVGGGYPKGSIAEELHQYFDARRSHASTVARTEVGRIKNLGAIDRYKDRKVEECKILDNEGPNSCSRCGELNGTIVTVEWAEENELEHPNCVRAFKPIIRGFKT